MNAWCQNPNKFLYWLSSYHDFETIKMQSREEEKKYVGKNKKWETNIPISLVISRALGMKN